VIELTKSMALELAPNLRVCAVAPGYVLTPMQRAEYTDEMLEEVNREDSLAASTPSQKRSQLCSRSSHPTTRSTSPVRYIRLTAPKPLGGWPAGKRMQLSEKSRADHRRGIGHWTRLRPSCSRAKARQLGSRM
jgi:NAD(P)-dependent dehydrogenase (short-subunit alcohol dehydrogenase family)